MTVEEFDAWAAFFRRWPFDDYHRFHRPAALVSVSMGGGEIQDRLDFLEPPFVDKTGVDRQLAMIHRKRQRK